MPEKITDIYPPRGIGRWFYRPPIPLYHIGLGWMMGQRFICITHIGRKTGQKRQTVLEVIRHDKTARIHYVVSAYGEKSTWFQNIQVHSDVSIQVGSKKCGLQRYVFQNPRQSARSWIIIIVIPNYCRLWCA